MSATFLSSCPHQRSNCKACFRIVTKELLKIKEDLDFYQKASFKSGELLRKALLGEQTPIWMEETLMYLNEIVKMGATNQNNKPLEV